MSIAVGDRVAVAVQGPGTLVNDGPGTVYYRDRELVTATLNDGSLRGGFSKYVDGTVHVIAASGTRSQVRLVAGPAPTVASEPAAAEGVNSIAYVGRESISATAERKLCCAPYPSRLLSAALVAEAAVPASETDYWSVKIAKYDAPALVPATLSDDFTTYAVGAEPNNVWTNDGATPTSSDFRMVRPSSGVGLVPANGANQVRLYHRNDFKTVDSEVIAYTRGAIGTDTLYSSQVMLKYLDTSNYLYLRFNTVGTQVLQIVQRLAATNTILGSKNLTSQLPAALTDTWVRGTIVGNNVTLEVWTTDPALGGSPHESTTWTLAGASATAFGTGVSGHSGFRFIASDPATARLLEWRMPTTPRTRVIRTVVEKNTFTKASGVNAQIGEAIAANQAWSFSGRPVAGARDLEAGDVVVATFTKTGAPADLVNPMVQIDLAPRRATGLASSTAPGAQTFHVCGDLHVTTSDYSYSLSGRLEAIRYDLEHGAVPVPEARWQVGDATNGSSVPLIPSEDAQFLAWQNSLPVDAKGRRGFHAIAAGNHELSSGSAPALRSAAAAMAAYGMPGVNYSRIYDTVKLITIGVEYSATGKLLYNATTLAWLAAEIASTDRPWALNIHAPLYNTVRKNNPAGSDSTDAGFFAVGPNDTNDTEIRAVIAAAASAPLFIISGHTHSDINDVGLVKVETIGAYEVACINAGSPYYTTPAEFGTAGNTQDAIWTVFLTIVPNTCIEVRWRDHGNGRDFGPAGTLVTTVPTA